MFAFFWESRCWLQIKDCHTRLLIFFLGVKSHTIKHGRSLNKTIYQFRAWSRIYADIKSLFVLEKLISSHFQIIIKLFSKLICWFVDLTQKTENLLVLVLQLGRWRYLRRFFQLELQNEMLLCLELTSRLVVGRLQSWLLVVFRSSPLVVRRRMNQLVWRLSGYLL